MSKQAVVIQEHTLGLLNQTGYIEVLSSSPIKGAPFRRFDDPIMAKTVSHRPATLADFDEFRVKHHPDYAVAGAQ